MKWYSETLNGCRVVLADLNKPGLPPAIEAGSTVREVVWGVASTADLALYSQRIANDPGFIERDGRIGCTDPNGLAIRLQVTRKRELEIECSGHNTWQTKGRINKAAPICERATPIEVGHVVFFVKDVNACEAFYHERFGFQASDRYRTAGPSCAPPKKAATTTCSCCNCGATGRAEPRRLPCAMFTKCLAVACTCPAAAGRPRSGRAATRCLQHFLVLQEPGGRAGGVLRR